MNKISRIFLVIIVACASLSSCKSAKKSTSDSIVESQKANEKFYLMLRLSKAAAGETIKVESVEKEVFVDQSNPLPLPPDNNVGTTFRCEVLNISNQMIATYTVQSEFKAVSADSAPEAVVKFIFRVDEECRSARVSREVKEGIWEEILTTSIESDNSNEIGK